MSTKPELTEDEADKRRSYGCLAIIAAPFLLIIILFFADQWMSGRRMKEADTRERRFKQYLAQLPDPFASNAIVFSSAPIIDVVGASHQLAIGSTNFDVITELAKREHSISYQIAVNEGRELLNKPPVYENDFREEWAQYILDLQADRKILFIPLDTKLQIIRQVEEGIFQCRVLQPDSEGLVLYIQSQYLTSKTTNSIPDEFLIK